MVKQAAFAEVKTTNDCSYDMLLADDPGQLEKSSEVSLEQFQRF